MFWGFFWFWFGFLGLDFFFLSEFGIFMISVILMHKVSLLFHFCFILLPLTENNFYGEFF